MFLIPIGGIVSSNFFALKLVFVLFNIHIYLTNPFNLNDCKYIYIYTHRSTYLPIYIYYKLMGLEINILKLYARATGILYLRIVFFSFIFVVERHIISTKHHINSCMSLLHSIYKNKIFDNRIVYKFT